MAKSPAAILYDANGVAMAVPDGVALPANTRGLIGVGYDGANVRFVRVDSSGRQVFVGAGIAGTPGGGVVSVQGVSGGEPLPVSGTVVVGDGGGSLTVDTPQLPAALVGGRLDVVVGAPLPAGTNNIGDVDVLSVPAPLSTTGGGTEAAALRVTIATDSTGLVSVDDNDGSLTTDTPQLPAALVSGRLDTNVGAWLGATTPTVGQKAMASSIPVALSSDQSAIPVSQSGTWTVQQGTPPWAVKGTDADGAAPTQNPVLVAGWDETNVQTLRTETDGTLRTRNNIEDDRQKLVSVNFGQSGVLATTYYVFIDLNGAGYKHTPGTKIIAAGAGGKAIKSNSGAKWSVSLMVVLRIDGTNADLGVLPIASVALWDTSLFGGGSQLILFPAVADLGVSGGAFTKITDGMKELNVAAVNTGVTFKDVLGNDVTPAVGDMLLRATLISGGGTLDFVYGMDYWVE